MHAVHKTWWKYDKGGIVCWTRARARLQGDNRDIDRLAWTQELTANCTTHCFVQVEEYYCFAEYSAD